MMDYAWQVEATDCVYVPYIIRPQPWGIIDVQVVNFPEEDYELEDE